MSRETIIADTSCLIVLENIKELSILHKLFEEIWITEEVSKEFGLALPDWIKIRQPNNQAKVDALNLILDKGEASSIALSLENSSSILIIDEKKGRRIAQELGVIISGTLGVILKAKENHLIDSIEHIVEKLEGAGFYLSSRLKEKLFLNL
jgi:predicted nucleic acid-binding protein